MEDFATHLATRKSNLQIEICTVYLLIYFLVMETVWLTKDALKTSASLCATATPCAALTKFARTDFASLAAEVTPSALETALASTNNAEASLKQITPFNMINNCELSFDRSLWWCYDLWSVC